MMEDKTLEDETVLSIVMRKKVYRPCENEINRQ